MRRFFVFILLLFIVLPVVPVVALAQTDLLENLQIDTAAEEGSLSEIADDPAFQADLPGLFQDFQKVKDKFLNNQTTANKEVFDQAAVAWARQLVQSQLEFLRQKESEFSSFVQVNEKIPNDWLQEEEDGLNKILNDLEKSADYASAGFLVKESAQVWQRVDKKINQLRAFAVYNNFFNLIVTARQLHDDLEKEQRNIEDNMVSEEKSIWDEWKLVFVTYSDKLSEIDQSLTGIAGEFSKLQPWEGLSKTDRIWQGKLTQLNDLLLDLESLEVLQSRAIADYYKIVDSLVFPANKSL